MMTIKHQKIFEKLHTLYCNDLPTELNFNGSFQLMVATILSAQCTDVRVNIVTNKLFSKYSAPIDFAKLKLETLEKLIYSTGFYRNKAKNIVAASKIIMEKYSGVVPNTMEELLTLPGVARKTANIILSVGYGVVEGIAVDTHVARLSHRMGFSKQKNPDKIEQDLMKLFKKKQWEKMNRYMVYHGRRVCKSQKPNCIHCTLTKICPKNGLTKEYKQEKT